MSRTSVRVLRFCDDGDRGGSDLVLFLALIFKTSTANRTISTIRGRP